MTMIDVEYLLSCKWAVKDGLSVEELEVGIRRHRFTIATLQIMIAVFLFYGEGGYAMAFCSILIVVYASYRGIRRTYDERMVEKVLEYTNENE